MNTLAIKLHRECIKAFNIYTYGGRANSAMIKSIHNISTSRKYPSH